MNPLGPALQIPAGLELVVDGGPSFRHLRGDRGLIERALNESGADRLPGGPSVTSYAEAWTEAIERWLGRFFTRHAAVWSGVVHGLEVLALILVAVAIGLLALALWRLYRKRGRAVEIAGREIREIEAGESVMARTAEEWKREMERRLGGGNLPGALEALWWWLARCLGGSQVDESWTSRQLLVTFGRDDLMADVGRLDHMIYGARCPVADEIRGLFARLAESVG